MGDSNFPELAGVFASLNRAWIEEFFRLEASDLEVFGDPYRAVVAPGGQIFFAVENGVVLGTCAALRLDADTVELAKMAVSPEVRGRGLGNLLLKAVVDFARRTGTKRVELLSNTRLGPAIALYRKHGFREIPLGQQEYSRANIRMELLLE